MYQCVRATVIAASGEKFEDVQNRERHDQQRQQRCERGDETDEGDHPAGDQKCQCETDHQSAGCDLPHRRQLPPQANFTQKVVRFNCH